MAENLIIPMKKNPVDSEGAVKTQTVLESRGYVLGKTIGIGCYAVVKIASDENRKHDVAVKIVSKSHAPAEYLTKFLPREIEVVKGLKHANMIRFYQAIETTHRLYIIMEFAPNGSLLDVIRQRLYIEEPQSHKWFNQLFDVVLYCHDRGVVHRDIKCENLLMDQHFDIKLSDFGFARGYQTSKNGESPLCDTFCGSYSYAAPEILKSMPYNPQSSDIWSMGVVLYAMVFGHLPFEESNYAELLKQVQEKIRFPKKPNVSNSCKSLIARILTPARKRPNLSTLKEDPWMTKNMSLTENPFEVEKPSFSEEQKLPEKEPKLITKETLIENAQCINAQASSEITIAKVEPENSSNVEVTQEKLTE